MLATSMVCQRHGTAVERTYLAANTARMATPPRTRSLQQRQALTLLDSLRGGAAEEFLLLCGFKREMLAQLFLAGLVTVVTETLETGGATIEVERYHITDKGREAIEE